MPKGIREKASDTLILENRLRNTKPGDVVTYDELSKIMGRDVREHCSGNLQTARRTLRNEKIHFDTVSRVGLNRLTFEEAVHSTQSCIDRSRNAAKNGLKILENVEFSELSPISQKEHLAKSAQLAAIKLFGGSNAGKKIEAKVDGKQLAIGETLKLFGG